ncbi:hypothetical protein [Litorihabitans aurantiacus]|uniref:Uncharacterized protein n=1 Tax=Litorihabitans aurantiacus TaxID=1930061 RepID=A0AA37XHS5_9MICO|nr:hypothetical protein [Litorihabitans aurantiacus]GMA33172.1 hypothetical protein GCM10025875_31640 [Litorihabitans aurantiacus]
MTDYPQQPAYGTPTGPGHSPFLLSVGDLHATSTELVTPSGTFQLREVSVYAIDQSSTTQRTPTWAVVLAVLGALFFLLGLLFLLVKETQTRGFVMITVEGQGRRHVSQVPIFDPNQRTDVMQRAAYLQMLAGQARQR